jgi:predicted RNase H-like HicB family nuclease
METITFLVEKVEGGYTAYAQSRSILSEGDTLQEVFANAREGLAVQCEDSGENLADFEVAFRFDIPAFFDAYPVVNIKALGERLGMNNTLISQYISGKKVPGPKQRVKIENGIHELARELAQLTFA